jgi:hypothetical protein
MTRPELMEYAKRRLSAGEAPPRVWPENETEIAAAIDTAMHRLADAVMNDDARRAWLQQEYELPIDENTGRGTLSDATATIAGELLLDGIRMGRVFDADGDTLWPLQHVMAFYSPQPSVKSYYCLVGGEMWTRNRVNQVRTPADVQTVRGPVKIIASFVPENVSSVPAILADDLVDTLVAVVIEFAKR